MMRRHWSWWPERATRRGAPKGRPLCRRRPGVPQRQWYWLGFTTLHSPPPFQCARLTVTSSLHTGGGSRDALLGMLHGRRGLSEARLVRLLCTAPRTKPFCRPADSASVAHAASPCHGRELPGVLSASAALLSNSAEASVTGACRDKMIWHAGVHACDTTISQFALHTGGILGGRNNMRRHFARH